MAFGPANRRRTAHGGSPSTGGSGSVWTRTLRERFLGSVDRRLPVDHWKNWYGKDAYLARRVELTEITLECEAAARGPQRYQPLASRKTPAISSLRSQGARPSLSLGRAGSAV